MRPGVDFIPPLCVILLQTGRASGAIFQPVKEIGDELNIAIEQIHANWSPGAAAAKVMVKSMDQAIDQQHFFSWFLSLGELHDKVLEQRHHFWPAAELLVANALEIVAPGAFPAT